MQSIWILLCTTVLIVTVVAEPPRSGYGGGSDLGFQSSQGQNKGVRYAGPIVYTNEKPPHLYFPPPPQMSTAKGLHGVGKGKSVKYVPMPTHDLPILIYQSDISPPLHVVSPPISTQTPKREKPTFPTSGYDGMRADYSNQAQTYSAPKPMKQKKRPTSDSDGYRTVESYPSSKSTTTYSNSNNGGSQNYYSRFPFTQSIKNFLEQSSTSIKSYAKPSRPKHKPSHKSDNMRGEYSSINEVYASPKSTSKKSTPLPSIIYTGHPPIHIFNQSPLYVPNSQTVSSKSHDLSGAHSEARPSYATKSQTRTKSSSHSSSGSGERQTYSSKPYGTQSSYNQHSYNKERPSYSSKKDGSKSGSYGHYKSYNAQKPTYAPKSQGSKSSSRGQSSGTYSSSNPSYSSFPNSYSSSAPPRQKSSSSSQYRSYSSLSKQFSPAPNAFKKPPIIIYQGLYPPHHVYENPAPAVDYRIGQPAAAQTVEIETSSPTFTSRMSSPDAGVLVDGSGHGIFNAQQAYWLPQFGMTAPAMYVSDLTSQGTAPQQYYSTVPQTLTAVSAPQTHTIQVQNADGSHSTAQVTTITTSADQVSNPSVNTPDEAHIDSIPTTFLASGLNNQNNPLIPMSYTSVIVQSAGSQPHQQ